MSNDFVANPGAGGDTFAALDTGTHKIPYSLIADSTGAAITGANPFPVNGTVGVSGSVAVTGTFWQATQPVSIASAIPTKPDGTIWALTGTSANVNLTNSSVAVTGTFWQSTQPVSGTVAATQSGTWSSRTQDGAGNVINSLSAGTNLNGLMVAIGATNYSLSAVNSTTANLAAGATFTGTIESGNSEPSVSIILTCDQPGIITLNQYITSSAATIVSSVSYVTPAVTGGNCFARSFTLNGNFVNVTFKNTGASTTTVLNLDTAYGTIPATTNLLNGPVALNEVNGTALSLGQTTMAASLPVAIASNQSALTVAQATPASLQVTATQAVGSAATRWFAQLSDGTNSPAVKAASTAAATTDPALVVSIAGANSATKIGDGTNSAAVKAASTAAATTDAALVVSMAGANSAVKVGDGTNNAAIKAASTAAAFTDPALTVDPRPGGALVTASAAMADAFANPTLGKQAVVNMVYNGTTWDLQRGMSGNLTTGDTGAKTATGNGATVANVGNKGVQIVVNMGTVTGTTPTCVLKVQGSVDGGTTWYDIPGATTASLTATGVFGITVYPGIVVTAGTTTTGTTATANGIIPRAWRMVWTIGGTTPSFTITNIQYNYIPN